MFPNVDSNTSFRAAKYVRHDMPWCLFSKAHQRLNKISSTHTRGPSKPSTLSQPPATVENIGPTVFELLERLYHDTDEISFLQDRVGRLKRRLRNFQALCDEMNSLILQHDNHPELDMEPHTFRHKAVLEKAEIDVADVREDLAEDETTIAGLKIQRSATWQKVFEVARLYFESCFEANFEAPWALEERFCRRLRNMIDQKALIAHNEAQIQELKFKLGNVKSRKRIAKKEAKVGPSRLDLTLAQALDETRDHQLDAELERVQSQIVSQQELLQVRKEFQSGDQDRFCKGVIKPLLEKAGRLATGSAGSQNGSGSSSENGRDRDRERTSTHNTQRQSDTANSSSRPASESADEKLQRQYLHLREELGEAQLAYSKRYSALENDELDHLLTFRNSSHEWYEAFIAQRLQDDARAIQLMETDVVKLRQRLVRDNISIPRSSSGSLRTVRDGRVSKGASSRASPQSRSRSPRPKRRKNDVVNGKMNDWRLKAGEAPRRSEITPSSGKSLAKTRSGVTSSRHGETASPDDDRERFLDGFRKENKRQQEQTRGKHGPLGVESEPEAE